VPAYDIITDNVQVNTEAAHHSTDSKNKFLIWSNALAVRHRVQPPESSTSTILAEQISLISFLPGDEDRLFLQERMDTIIQRILVKNIDYFKECEAHVEWHVPHRFSVESAAKSEVVSIDHYAKLFFMFYVFNHRYQLALSMLTPAH
jgi:hypothetical protein